MFEHNHQAFETRWVVRHYSQLRQLQPAEHSILNLLQNEWSNMKMLDIGVGAGRTTQYFSKIVQEYVGIDYSKEMITACQKRFPHSSLFEVVDARDLSQFQDNYFDFILFSFNGIDCLSHLDRLRSFQEINRVGKAGGYFFFSSHNLQGLERELNWKNQISLNPITIYVNMIMFLLLRLFNPSISPKTIKNSGYEIIQDEAHNFRLKQYYIRPQNQIDQLKSVFDSIQVYSWKSGLEITHPQEFIANTEMWVYYLCRIRHESKST